MYIRVRISIKISDHLSVSTHLHSHVIGFPQDNNKSQDVQGTQISMKDSRGYNSSAYNVLYKMFNSYLSNGYSVLYGAESIPNESTKEKIFENIVNVNP